MPSEVERTREAACCRSELERGHWLEWAWMLQVSRNMGAQKPLNRNSCSWCSWCLGAPGFLISTLMAMASQVPHPGQMGAAA